MPKETHTDVDVPPVIAENPHYNPYYRHKANWQVDLRNAAGSLSSLQELKLGQLYRVIGRINYKRNLGAIIFIHVTSHFKSIQLLFNHQQTADYVLSKKLTRGDLIYVQGIGTLSKTNHFTILVTRFLLVSPTYAELPDKVSGLRDGAINNAQRYLSLLTNTQLNTRISKRMQILRGIRQFMYARAIPQIDPNILGRSYGGAVALPFITKLESTGQTFFMSIAPQLRLKELLFAGYPSVFTITHNYRNQGIDRTHQPEFSAAQVYIADRNYHYMIKLYEQMVKKLVAPFSRTYTIPYGDHKIDLKSWRIVRYQTLLEEHFKITRSTSMEQIVELLKSHNLMVYSTREECCYQLFDKVITAKLIQPTAIIDYPQLSTPLAKRCQNNPAFCEQCEVYIAGMEMANIYTEENDPLALMRSVNAFKKYSINANASMLDEGFIRMLSYGMPHAGGIGFGIDRLIMLLTNAKRIQDVVPFPL